MIFFLFSHFINFVNFFTSSDGFGDTHLKSMIKLTKLTKFKECR
jgi:hypothetical protein